MKRFIALLLTIMMFVVFTACSSEEPPKKEVIRPVKAMLVGGVAAMAEKGYPATSKASQEIELSFRVGGPLIKNNIIQGALVKKGAIVAEIDPRDYKIAEKAARARYEQTKAESERYYRLWKKGSIAKNDYDLKRANYLEAKAAWEEALNNLKDTKLRAPFTGFLGPKLVDVGEEVKPKQPITTLADLSVIEIVTTIPEQLAVKFRNFKSYEVRFETYPDHVFTARLKEMEKTPTPEGFKLHLYLNHKNDPKNPNQPKITSGMSCRVTIKLKSSADEANDIIVPVGAVFEGETDNQPSVWIIDPESLTVKKQHVVLGGFVGKNHVKIKKGLTPGVQIVAAGSKRLVEGQKVKILNHKNFN